jgi:hypothetical protein
LVEKAIVAAVPDRQCLKAKPTIMRLICLYPFHFVLSVLVIHSVVVCLDGIVARDLVTRVNSKKQLTVPGASTRKQTNQYYPSREALYVNLPIAVITNVEESKGFIAAYS